jgi:hypothetical protein
MGDGGVSIAARLVHPRKQAHNLSPVVLQEAKKSAGKVVFRKQNLLGYN